MHRLSLPLRPLLLTCLLLSISTPCFAWSLKEHILMTRLAAERLIADPATPPAMKGWLLAANRGGKDLEAEKQFFLHQRVGLDPHVADGLGYWSARPDVDKGNGGPGSTIEPFGVSESKLHFTDLEMFNSDKGMWTFKDDLSHKPKVSDIPRDLKDERWKRAGMLPFRVEDCYGKLVRSIREGKLMEKEGQPKDDHAEHWAGYLAHYLEDNCQPHHATMDYMSRSYFGKDNPRSPNVHFNVEGLLDDDDKNDYMALREEFWPLFARELDELKDPTESDDPWNATIEVLMKSYDALPLIGRAAMAGYKIGGTPEAPEGHASPEIDADAFFHYKGKVGDQETTMLQMKAHQMAWAVKRVERVWKQAWIEAQGSGK